MAALLRSPRVFRVVPGLLRAIQAQSNGYGSTANRLTLCTVNSPILENIRALSISSVVNQTSQVNQETEISKTVRADNEFRTVLRRLDDMVRRTGRITKNQLLLVFDEVCNMGTATPNQALLLIRSCGSLLPEVKSEERTALAHKFWDKLGSIGATYDVSHYNALLNVYLQNEHKFSPTDFLANMESKSIEPNRVTYQRLISAYCLLGDIQGATKILEFMKIKELPVTEGVFNSLITGHARAGDMDNARNILAVMRNVGLEPSQETYSTLMCALAEKGDIQGIEELIVEAEAQVGELADRYYLNSLYSLATSGHEEHFPKLLERVRLGAGFVPEAINLCITLISRGNIDAAFSIIRVFKSRKMDTSTGDDHQNHGNFFIDPLVQLGTPHETLFKYLDAMISEGIHASPYIVAVHVGLRNQTTIPHEYTIGLMKRMVELDLPVRPHYFWPMMATEVNQGNGQGVLSLAKAMVETGVPVNVETFSRYVIPAVDGSATNMIQELQGFGVELDKQLLTAVCRHEATKNKLASIVKIVEQYPGMVDIGLFKTGLINSFNRSPQVEPLVKLLTYLWTEFKEDKDSDVTKEDYLGSVLYEIIKTIPEQRASQLKPHVQLLFDKLFQQGIKISAIRFRGVRNLLDQIKLAPLKQSAYKLLDPNSVNVNPMGNVDLIQKENLSVESLEEHLKEMKEKGGNYRTVLRQLILLNSASDNFNRCMELMEEFEAKGYEATGAIYAAMLTVCSKNQQLDSALKYKEKVKQFDPYFKLDMSKYKPLICELAKANRMDEALNLIEDMKVSGVGTDRQEKQLFHLLNDLAQAGLPEQTQQIFDKLVELELINVNSNILGPVVTAYIVKNDIAGAMECVKECQTKYKLMPHFHEILIKLVEEGDTEQLQKAMDFTSEHHGDINMLYDLIFAFLSTGKFKEAKKIFETPGLVAKDRRLQWYAEHCIGKNMPEALENLCTLSKDLYGCDRDNLHFYLLQLYARQREPDKCLQVWTSMQDEGVVPKDRTLRYLANVLRSYDKPVPFQVPQLIESTMSHDDPAVDCQNKIISTVQSGDLEGATKMLEEAISGGIELKMQAYEALMWENLHKNNTQEFMRIKEMCKDLKDFSVSKHLMNKLMLVYVNQGNEEAAHELFDEQLDQGNVPIRSGLRYFALKYEETGNLEKLLEMRMKYEEKTQETFPMGKAILGSFIKRNDIAGAVSFIEQEVERDITKMKRLGLRSFFVRLLQSGANMEEVLEMVDRLNEKDLDGGVWQLLFAHLDCNQIEQAKALAEKYPVIKEKSSGLIGYIISMIGKDSDLIGKITNVLEMTKGSDYLDKSKVYFYLFKAYDQANNWEEALKLREKMELDNVPVTDFNLKRIALLLQRNKQPVPFDEPPNPLSHYRDQSRLDQKDNLPEIEEIAPEGSRRVNSSTE
ncbi:leucine-rich PPR motif-containing protein, mitochondrial-like [Asterias amurensis]|uniref:leucine-rich PPR motif-containing protein, mitochondrial-like n=1 Tax=Asterias amurensis TaxID=7602 RepID=UPI003AB11F82